MPPASGKPHVAHSRLQAVEVDDQLADALSGQAVKRLESLGHEVRIPPRNWPRSEEYFQSNSLLLAIGWIRPRQALIRSFDSGIGSMWKCFAGCDEGRAWETTMDHRGYSSTSMVWLTGPDAPPYRCPELLRARHQRPGWTGRSPAGHRHPCWWPDWEPRHNPRSLPTVKRISKVLHLA